MATNPHVNKVVYGGNTLIDTSNVTVTPDTLAEGYTALDASGALITGTAKQSSVIDLSKFSNINSHVNTPSFFRLRVGNVVYLSIRIDGAVTVGSSGVKLFDIDASVAPRQQNVTCPVFSSSGSIVSNASVWIEALNPTAVTLYGASLSAGAYYCNLTYVI